MSTIEQHRIRFTKRRPEEIERLHQFGEVRRYKAGDLLFMTGEPSPGMFVLIVTLWNKSRTAERSIVGLRPL